MTEHILLSISSHQVDLGDDGDTELITAADYYFKNGKHYIAYTESDTENGGETGNTIKIASDRVDVIRRGVNPVHMVFEQGKHTLACYHTPAGGMMMETQTSNIETQETEEEIRTRIDYMLYLNEQFISECQVTMTMRVKKKASLF